MFTFPINHFYNAKKDVGNGLRFNSAFMHHVVIPAVPTAIDTWTVCFFFRKIAITPNTSPIWGVESVLSGRDEMSFIAIAETSLNIWGYVITSGGFIANEINFCSLRYREGIIKGNINNLHKSNFNLGYNPMNSQFKHIGSRRHFNNVHPFNQILHDLKMYDVDLSDIEEQNIFLSKGNEFRLSNLVYNYNFEQKSNTVLLDSSGNTRNGTLINYTSPQVSLGSNNLWVDQFGNPILI